MKMRKVFLTIMCLWVMGAAAAGVKPGSEKTLVDSCGFFPQLSPDGQWLLYSPIDGGSLQLKNLFTGAVTTVADKGYPGYDALLSDDGKVYYITQQHKRHNLVYRTGRCYDPSTGRDRVVLKAQHGRVQALRAGGDVVVNGEHKRYKTNKQVGAYCYTIGDAIVMVDPSGGVRALQPVKDSNGYLWAAMSPNGQRVLFEAAGQGLFVCDLNGEVVADLGQFLMPCWYNDEYIVAMSNSGNVRTSGSRIWLLSVDGEVCKPISPQGERAVQPMVAGNKVVYTQLYSGEVRQLELDIQPAPRPEPVTINGKTEKVPRMGYSSRDLPRVFINPGHGGHDSNDRHVPTWVIGAQDTVHYYESNSNLTKGLALVKILEEKGYETAISRTTNFTEDDLDLFEIVSLAANSGADIFFSIHSNATGIEKRINFPLGLYCGWDGKPAVEGSQRLSELVMAQLIKNQVAVWTGKQANRGDWSFYDWGYKVGLGVLRFNKLPGFLSEGSFHDYLPERERLLSDGYCWLEAWNQSVGIDWYFNRQKLPKTGVIAGTVRWSDVMRTDEDRRLFGEDELQPVNGALLRLYNDRGALCRIYTIDDNDNGVFVFSNLPAEKYKLELYYNDQLYESVKIKVKKNQTSYRNFTLKTDQKPKKKK